jgi:hypothetical protein
MDKVQKHDYFKCSIPLSEPFRIDFKTAAEHFGQWKLLWKCNCQSFFSWIFLGFFYRNIASSFHYQNLYCHVSDEVILGNKV